VAVACPSAEVRYYGASFEGDAFLWCIDKSASIDSAGHFYGVKAELVAAISGLTLGQRFTVLAFSSGFQTFSPVLVAATSANRAAASAWVQSLTADGSTCLAPAAIQALSILQLDVEPFPVMFITSDGEPNCPPATETLAVITAANFTSIPIHTFQIGTIPGSGEFLSALAAMNGGDFIPSGGLPDPAILRGDADGDGLAGIGDAIRILEFGFGLDCRPICRDAADVTDDGIFEPISDAVTLLGALFIPGHAPVPEPAIECGVDPTADGLPCLLTICP
jgi:hypothetical protein